MKVYFAIRFVLICWEVACIQAMCAPGIPLTAACKRIKADPGGSELAPLSCACHKCEDEPFYGCANAATKGVVVAGQRDGCPEGTCSQCKPAGASCSKGDACCDAYIINYKPYILPHNAAHGYCSAQGKCALCAADKHLCRYSKYNKIPCCSALTNHSSSTAQCLLSRDEIFSYCVTNACLKDPEAPLLYGLNCPPISKDFYFCACGEVNKKGKVVKDFKQCKGSSCEKCIPPGHACTPGKTERECCFRENEYLRNLNLECRNGKCQECFALEEVQGLYYKGFNCNSTKIPCCLDVEDPEYTYKCTAVPEHHTFSCQLQ